MAKIILVDDEAIHLRVLEKFLENGEHELRSASDGETALRLVREEKPDLVVLDALMPGMDGLDVCRRLKGDAETMYIPVIITTGLLQKENRLKGLAAGAEDFLTKPIDGLELTTRVKNLLRTKAYHDHIRSHNETLEKEVADRTGELKKTLVKLRGMNDLMKKGYLDTIHRLAMAAEYRDMHTGCHIRRMSRMTEVIAAGMGVPDAEIETILYASPMHDIGKIGIPDRILLKPGKLNGDEWDIMKQHTTIGAAILSGSDSELLLTAESIALMHHEKYDGSGYPRGLSGGDIPLAARITAVADVFDALISERPYKRAFSVGESLEIVRSGAGNHFDPGVVEVFFEKLDGILEIAEGSRESGREFALPAVS